MSARIRTLVADDEPIARERMLALLRDEPDIELIGECATGPEAIVVGARGGIMLKARARPVIQGVAQPSVAGIPHVDEVLPFATAFGDGRRTGVGS